MQGFWYHKHSVNSKFAVQNWNAYSLQSGAKTGPIGCGQVFKHRSNNLLIISCLLIWSNLFLFPLKSHISSHLTSSSFISSHFFWPDSLSFHFTSHISSHRVSSNFTLSHFIWSDLVSFNLTPHVWHLISSKLISSHFISVSGRLFSTFFTSSHLMSCHIACLLLNPPQLLAFHLSRFTFFSCYLSLSDHSFYLLLLSQLSSSPGAVVLFLFFHLSDFPSKLFPSPRHVAAVFLGKLGSCAVRNDARKKASRMQNVRAVLRSGHAINLRRYVCVHVYIYIYMYTQA